MTRRYERNVQRWCHGGITEKISSSIIFQQTDDFEMPP